MDDVSAPWAGLPAAQPMPQVVWLVAPACVLLPWLGAMLADAVPSDLYAFPPPTDIPRDYPRFSWWATWAIILPAALLAAWWWFGHGRRRRERAAATFPLRARRNAPAQSRFPWWGVGAIAWTLLWWVLAWNRFAWFAGAQAYTFAPLWLGFIVTVNAVACWRNGTCLLVRSPGCWLLLFGVSAAFWWVFEWLNRFVDNWHYLGVARFTATEYAIHATVCFSTVLPAVTAVRECLGGWQGLQAALSVGPSAPGLVKRRHAAAASLGLGIVGLILAGALPRYFYAALWLAPLLIGLGLALRSGARGWWCDLERGDWRDAGSWALAALICGFWWELWNLQSLARWVYTVPFVDRWHVFAMPALGYTGYLPFGLECALVVAVVRQGFRRERAA